MIVTLCDVCEKVTSEQSIEELNFELHVCKSPNIVVDICKVKVLATYPTNRHLCPTCLKRELLNRLSEDLVKTARETN